MTDEPTEPLYLGAECGPSCWRDAVVAPPVIIELGYRSLGRLDDEALVDEATDGVVEHPWAELDSPVGEGLRGRHDPVPVSVALGQHQEDVEMRVGKHQANYTLLRYTVNRYS